MLTVNWLSLSIVAGLVVFLVFVFVQTSRRRRRAADLRDEIGVDNAQFDQEETTSSRDETMWRRSYSR